MELKNNIIKNKNIFIALILFIISFILFIINIAHEQIWYDESLTLFFTNLDFGSMIKEIGFNGAEANPPFYHIIIKILRILFGDSLYILRGFSALCSSILVLCIYFFTKKMFDEKTALISCLLFMFNPIIISFAQELRMYALAGLLLTINIFSIYFALKEKKIKYWILYIISSILGLYTHYYFIFSFVIFLIFFILYIFINKVKLKDEKKTILLYLTANIIIILCYIPWIPALLKQMKDMSYAAWTEPIRSDTLFKTIGYFFTTKFTYDVNPVIPYFIITLLSLVFIIFGIYYKIRKKEFKIEIILLILAFFVPIIITYFYSLIFYSIINFRYFIIYFQFFIILFAIGLRVIPYKKISYILLVIFIMLTSPTIYKIYTDNFNGSSKDTSFFLKLNSKKTEPIIVFENATFLTLYYYLNKPDNLYFYSDNDLPDCYGVNINKKKYIVGKKINKLISNSNSYWIVVTPWVKKSGEKFISKFSEYEIDNNIPPIVLKYEYSWLRFKIFHLVKQK